MFFVLGLGLEKCVKLLHYPLVTFFSTVTDDLSPRKYRIRSYDILNVLWTYIYFRNVAHYKIDFISL